MKPKCSSSDSQRTAIRSYLEPVKSTLKFMLIWPFSLRLCPLNRYLPFRSSTIYLYVFLIYPMRATYHAHFILLYLFTLTVLGDCIMRIFITCKLHQNIITMIKSRKIRWTVHVAYMREMRNAYQRLVGKHERKRLFGRLRRRWEDKTRMYLR